MKYLGINKILSVILVVSIIVSSAMLIYIVVMPEIGESFTELYILNKNGTASDYPTDLKVGEEGEVIIGIVNQEYEKIIYRLVVSFNGSLIYEENVSLIENEKWESAFIFKATKIGKNQKLEFLLYKDQKREVYRILHLLISVT